MYLGNTMGTSSPLESRFVRTHWRCLFTDYLFSCELHTLQLIWQELELYSSHDYGQVRLFWTSVISSWRSSLNCARQINRRHILPGNLPTYLTIRVCTFHVDGHYLLALSFLECPHCSAGSDYMKDLPFTCMWDFSISRTRKASCEMCKGTNI